MHRIRSVDCGRQHRGRVLESQRYASERFRLTQMFRVAWCGPPSPLLSQRFLSGGPLHHSFATSSQNEEDNVAELLAGSPTEYSPVSADEEGDIVFYEVSR